LTAVTEVLPAAPEQWYALDPDAVAAKLGVEP